MVDVPTYVIRAYQCVSDYVALSVNPDVRHVLINVVDGVIEIAQRYVGTTAIQCATETVRRPVLAELKTERLNVHHIK